MNLSLAVCCPVQTGPTHPVRLNVVEPQESFMKSAHVLVIAVSLGFIGQVSAQDPSSYRAYVLESSLDTVVAASGMRATDAKTLHERRAKIQQLQWRAPYASPRTAGADPVREVACTFFNSALYQIVVTYDRYRTEGLTNDDVIESLSSSYGTPVLKTAIVRTGLPALLDAVVLAQWDNLASSLTLLRDTYSPEFQLILTSKALNAPARSAIREAIRLDALEAPQRELDQRKKDVAEASATRYKARSTNKAAFRP